MAPSTPFLFLLFSFPYLLPALEISIGGGGNDAPPPSSGDPQPCEFANDKQYRAYLVIQRFKRTITCDPQGVTTTWNGPRVCDYKGFTCAGPPNSNSTPTIATADFNGYRLAAPTVSGFVDKLPDLAFFHANSNNFAGDVPDLSHLPFFYELDVSNNLVSGNFPAAATSVEQLTFLDLRFNSFSGCVSPSVFELRKLEVIFLNNNGLSGALPANLGSTPAKYITFANNGFTGSIPASIGRAAGTLLEIVFLNNRLSGCLPYEIGLLSKATLFDAGNNQISGEIPKSFACLASIEQLNLAGNMLFGEVPDAVCRLPRLQNLSLSGNYFTSLGPSCSKLKSKGLLDISGNCVPGCTGQRPPEQCHKFFSSGPKSCEAAPNHNVVPCKLPWCGPLPPRRRALSVRTPVTYAAMDNPNPRL